MVSVPLLPREIRLHSQSNELELVWSDDIKSRLSGALLRKACRCADCLSTGERNQVEEDALLIRNVVGAGHYGIQIIFSDGHDRGIYPWLYLRELGQV